MYVLLDKREDGREKSVENENLALLVAVYLA